MRLGTTPGWGGSRWAVQPGTKVMGHCHRAPVGTALVLVATMMNPTLQIRKLRQGEIK